MHENKNKNLYVSQLYQQKVCGHLFSKVGLKFYIVHTANNISNLCIIGTSSYQKLFLCAMK